jgi:hypothetical protein
LAAEQRGSRPGLPEVPPQQFSALVAQAISLKIDKLFFLPATR